MTKEQQKKQYESAVKKLDTYDKFDTKETYIKVYKLIYNQLKIWENDSLLSDLMKRYHNRYLHYSDTRTVDEKISDYKKAHPITDKIRK